MDDVQWKLPQLFYFILLDETRLKIPRCLYNKVRYLRVVCVLGRGGGGGGSGGGAACRWRIEYFYEGM
jgi:hypothetical protein